MWICLGVFREVLCRHFDARSFWTSGVCPGGRLGWCRWGLLRFGGVVGWGGGVFERSLFLEDG